jgi:hypothetical protein
MLELIKEAHCLSSITATLQKFSKIPLLGKDQNFKLLRTAWR